MKYTIETLVDHFRKSKILKMVRTLGLDCDGDILWYKGTHYYVHEREQIVTREKKENYEKNK